MAGAAGCTDHPDAVAGGGGGGCNFPATLRIGKGQLIDLGGCTGSFDPAHPAAIPLDIGQTATLTVPAGSPAQPILGPGTSLSSATAGSVTTLTAHSAGKQAVVLPGSLCKPATTAACTVLLVYVADSGVR